ncbi:MAG: ribosome-associated translation inhibitor RaiA [Alphaproteobacteria bacterium]|nr:ribosome-associated translation inhibitor RaiA [Alphaproteobacteria bacterium]
MELTVHGKQMDVGDALKTHVSDKLEDLNQKYFNHAAFATVTFSREGHGHPQTKVHISIQMGKNLMVVADALANDPYASFESAADKVGKQLRRYKRKLRDNHARQEHTPEEEIMKARGYVLASQGPEEISANDDNPQTDDPAIIAEIEKEIETISVSDAVMRLELSQEPALMFRNAKHGGLNMIYRRPDGNIGWVDPQD